MVMGSILQENLNLIGQNCKNDKNHYLLIQITPYLIKFLKFNF